MSSAGTKTKRVQDTPPPRRRLEDSDRTSRLTGKARDWLVDPELKAAGATDRLSITVLLLSVGFMTLMMAYHTGHLPMLGRWADSALGFLGAVLH